MRVVVQDLRNRGVDATGALREAGLNALALADDEGWIPFVKDSALLDCPVALTGVAERKIRGFSPPRSFPTPELEKSGLRC
jgi:hypothetical protein